jgi:cytochrome d ubiquinol oxidase subunit I
MGVVTGIVQEFQFGMNWSNYSVFVGNIFGAPLAFEGLLAFFLESTFIGVWIFGRKRLSPLVHTLSICLASLGSIVSAFFILTANAWMQHPVGYRIVGHGAGRKAVLTDFWAVLRNSTLWAEFSHAVLAAFVTGAMFILGVSAWQILRGRNAAAFTRAARLGAVVALICVVLVILIGDLQARLMDTQQPMKKTRANAAAARRPKKTSKTSTVGCGRYWAKSPVMSGPSAAPPVVAAVATSDARREEDSLTVSVSAALAAPVIRPADTPERIRGG